MRRAAHIVWLLLAVLVRQSGLCALLPGTVLPQAALAAPPAPLSGNRSDTVQHVELSFRFDRSLLDSAYRDNSSALHTLRNWLGPSCCASRIDSIGIFSYSSMEGYGWHNGQLARDRGRAVKGYLVWKYPHLNQYRIYIHPQGEDWAGLLRRLSDMPDLPSRDQIANLFDAGLSEEELKNRFRILIDSQSYRYLQSTLFPSLRRAIVRIYWKDSVPDVLTARIRSDAFSAAIADGLSNFQISSAYRTYSEQQKLVDNSVAKYQKNNPDWSRDRCLSATYNTVAPAGTSEHQTGLAFDITVPNVSFTGTAQQKWLHEHCAKYGFVVRFTADKQKLTGFVAESWHFRYVGVEAAQTMTQNNWCLEEYVEKMGL